MGVEAQPPGQHREVEVAEQEKATTWNTELIATSTAAASLSPHARSFQITTMAMHRARPTMISPVRYSGRSGRNAHARANISAGPTSQFSTSELTRSFLSPVTAPTRSYRTLASTGYIITSRPRAIGTEIPPTSSAASTSERAGTNRPRVSPATIASPIHSGSHRSSVDNRPRVGAVGSLARGS